MIARTNDPIRKLNASDHSDDFDCGQPALNLYLQRFALSNQKANSAQTYVACCAEEVVGFYSLAVGSVESGVSAPVMLLTRLAVDNTHQGVGLGRALLKDALIRTGRAADIAGIRALLVHAKDEEAKNWYRQWEFEPSVTDPLHLYLLVKDLRAMVSDSA